MENQFIKISKKLDFTIAITKITTNTNNSRFLVHKTYKLMFLKIHPTLTVE